MNKKRILSIIFFLIFSFLFAQPACAHLPRLVATGEVVKVQNPEISQAFYGKLNGAPQVYELNLDKDLLVYLNILLPAIKGTPKDFTAEIYTVDQDNKEVLLRRLFLDNRRWTDFYEPFAGDDYYKGPEYKRVMPAGKYVIKVLNPYNYGKYVLAVGEIEAFTFKESINTIKLLPTLKTDFFEKSIWSIFINLIGLYSLLVLMALCVIVFFSVRWIKIFRRNKKIYIDE